MRGFDQQFVITLARIFWGTGTAKIGGAVALAGASPIPGILLALADAVASRLGLEVALSEVPIWFNVMLVFTGLAVVLYGARTPAPSPEPERPKPNAHDHNLFEKYRALVLEGDLDFLRTQDFGAPFAFTSVDGICEIGGHWNGPRFEFSDQELESSFRAVKDDAKAFANAVMTHVHPSRGNINIATTKPDDVSFQYSEWHRAANRELNELASKLTDSLDAFERIGRDKLS